MKALKIGWAGLGNMGTAMASNLLKAGYEVIVYNRTRDKEAALTAAGASSAASLPDLVDSCDVIFTMLSDDHAVKAVYNKEELLSEARAGKLFIDMSTVSPDTSKYLSSLCQKHEANFLDAPVSGSVKPAQDGTLIILAGGSIENYEKAKPLFDVLGKLSLHLGEAGAGSSAKLAINYLLGINILGLAETVLFAGKNGISKENMLTIINEGAVGNGLTKLKTPSILNNEFPAAFALKYIVKDLNLAKDAGLASPMSETLLSSFNQAVNQGLGDEDLMAVIKSLK
ncbi:NAD(P)-dependent oxidoreductase [Pedobacter sp. MC2016-14]|uniref:NAD(P)-dependent oxidoreductase n=1 Tax=Pedobacter sp. MC2016-14 TaxID=2897327 RepID=UPI001E3CB005|nr:NAD(P)-dependent oxidoreductase [Pedobacter sp. MC2016-14]MCD0490060.1 NAD(P)-dependent oxidoreductase [Pedobacter sp. MC2016-14]